MAHSVILSCLEERNTGEKKTKQYAHTAVQCHSIIYNQWIGSKLTYIVLQESCKDFVFCAVCFGAILQDRDRGTASYIYAMPCRAIRVRHYDHHAFVHYYCVRCCCCFLRPQLHASSSLTHNSCAYFYYHRRASVYC